MFVVCVLGGRGGEKGGEGERGRGGEKGGEGEERREGGGDLTILLLVWNPGHKCMWTLLGPSESVLTQGASGKVLISEPHTYTLTLFPRVCNGSERSYPPPSSQAAINVKGWQCETNTNRDSNSI